MFVRTKQWIKQGEEITVDYFDYNQHFYHRQEFLQDKFGFECKCELCVLDKMTLPVINDILESKMTIFKILIERRGSNDKIIS